MKRNYQKDLESLLESLTDRPKLLLHSCCGPCSSYVTEYLSRYFDISIYYFNPNIYPEEEYIKRLNTQKQLLDATGWAKLDDSDYNHADFLEAVRGLESEPEGGARCAPCFRMRLEATARRAVKEGFRYFGTTLTVSPHKNAELLNNIGKEVADKYAINWIPSDFKKKEGYKRSIELSREYELYRQNYCGCEFSLRDAIEYQTAHSCDQESCKKEPF